MKTYNVCLSILSLSSIENCTNQLNNFCSVPSIDPSSSPSYEPSIVPSPFPSFLPTEIPTTEPSFLPYRNTNYRTK